FEAHPALFTSRRRPAMSELVAERGRAMSELARQRHHRGLAQRPERAERVVDRRRLVAAVDHAIATLLVTALLTVALPGRRLHQLTEARRVAFLQKVAGPLPAEEVERRVPPRRAVVLLLAHQEAQKEGRLVEPPPLLRVPEHLGEELMRPGASKEVLLVRRLVVTI